MSTHPPGNSYSNITASDNTRLHLGNNIYNVALDPLTKEAKEAKIIDALFLTRPEDDRSGLIATKGNRANGTCEWLTSHPTYTAWLTSSNSQLLWLSGGPGKGKTMLSIYLTYELEKLVKSKGDVLLYYFCDNKDKKRNTAFAILRGLLYQLLKQQSQLFQYILDDFKGPKEEEFTLSSLDALWRIFTAMLQDSNLHSVLCVIDGLDECEEDSLKLFLKKLKDFFLRTGNAPSVGNLRLLVLGRDRPACIESQLCEFDRIRLDPDLDDEVNRDVGIYISLKVSELAVEKRLSTDDLERVTQSLTNGANGTFLWVGFVADQLKGKTKTEVEEILKDLPPGLDSIYERMLQQIEPKRRESVAIILQWVVVAQRPLTLTELAVATNTHQDVMRDRLESCGQLLLPLTVDKKVSLIHQSAKDYLQRIEPYKTEAHLAVANTCFKYVQEHFSNSAIKLQGERHLDEETSSLLREYPLLEYAAIYWPEHAGYASNAIEDIFDFSGPFCQKKSAVRDYWWRYFWSSKSYDPVPTPFSLMHIAAYFGIAPLAQKLIKKDKLRYKLPFQNPGSKKDSSGRTPLSWAAENGHMVVVKLLLEKGAEAETKDLYGRTALSLAANNGHEAIVKLLLDKKGSYSWAALLLAAENGHEAIVKLLLEKGAKLETKDITDQTALLYAAEIGYEAIVKLLLEKGAELETKDDYKRTALLYAAENGHKAIVKLLLEKGAELETKDNYKRTALLYAAKNEHEAIVKLLLEKGAELETKDDYKMTALLYAAENGYEAIVKLLLEKGAELETKDDYERTALLLAAKNGHEAIVKLLLDKGAEPKTRDNTGRTALSRAAEDGHEAIVKLLLEKGAEIETGDYASVRQRYDGL